MKKPSPNKRGAAPGNGRGRGGEPELVVFDESAPAGVGAPKASDPASHDLYRRPTSSPPRERAPDEQAPDEQGPSDDESPQFDEAARVDEDWSHDEDWVEAAGWSDDQPPRPVVVQDTPVPWVPLDDADAASWPGVLAQTDPSTDDFSDREFRANGLGDGGLGDGGLGDGGLEADDDPYRGQRHPAANGRMPSAVMGLGGSTVADASERVADPPMQLPSIADYWPDSQRQVSDDPADTYDDEQPHAQDGAYAPQGEYDQAGYDQAGYDQGGYDQGGEYVQPLRETYRSGEGYADRTDEAYIEQPDDAQAESDAPSLAGTYREAEDYPGAASYPRVDEYLQAEDFRDAVGYERAGTEATAVGESYLEAEYEGERKPFSPQGAYAPEDTFDDDPYEPAAERDPYSRDDLEPYARTEPFAGPVLQPSPFNAMLDPRYDTDDEFAAPVSPHAGIAPVVPPGAAEPKPARRGRKSRVAVLVVLLLLVGTGVTLAVLSNRSGEGQQYAAGQSPIGGQAGTGEQQGAAVDESASGNSISAPLNGRTAAGFDLVNGASTVNLRTSELGDDLYRVSTPDGSSVMPQAAEQANRVQLFLVRSGASGPGRVDIELNANVSWDLRVTGGIEQGVIDMSNSPKVTGVDLAGGATRLDLALPRPDGTLKVRMTGGINQFQLTTAEVVPVRVRIGSGAGQVVLYGRTNNGVAPGSQFVAGKWDAGGDRIDLDAVAGLATLTVSEGQG